LGQPVLLAVKINVPVPVLSPPPGGAHSAFSDGAFLVHRASQSALITSILCGNMREINILLWDIDGTLLSSGGAGKAAIEGALTGEFGVTIRGQVPYSGRTDRAICRDLLQLHELEDSADNWRRLVAGYLKRLPSALASHRGAVLPGVAALL